MRWTMRNLDTILAATLAHLGLVFSAIALALLLALPLGLLVARRPRLQAALLGTASLLYSLPTLALFALLVPVLGLGFWPALVALVSYAVPVLLRALVAGLAGAPPATLDAADGMGLTPAQRLWEVELPLTLPALLGGLRVASVTLVSAATVAAYISAGGLGTLILTGLDQGIPKRSWSAPASSPCWRCCSMRRWARCSAACRRSPDAGAGGCLRLAARQPRRLRRGSGRAPAALAGGAGDRHRRRAADRTAGGASAKAGGNGHCRGRGRAHHPEPRRAGGAAAAARSRLHPRCWRWPCWRCRRYW
ncbi:ABC transporter permease [Siccirubricoccus deserti]